MRKWSLRSQDWKNEGGEALIQSLAKETRLSPMTLRICLSRGLKTAEEIREFLVPKLEKLTDPMKLKDMDKAVERLAIAKERGDQVRIYGDYDVDGTTGAALLSCFFRELGLRFDALQPDRFRDGYGLGVKAVEDAAKDGVRVLVTVDCGITGFDAALKAEALGIDLIILDHHHVDDVRGIPAGAYAVIDAHRPDDDSGLKELCGCGVAFYLCRALRSEGRKRQWWTPGNEPNLKQHLDLVVMATAADMVPLVRDNHILVRHGLDVLKQTTKPGVAALLESAGIAHRDVSPSHLGFAIGPRINASGRMSSASHALELLTTQDLTRATNLAFELEKLNQERQDLQNRIWDEVRTRVEEGIAKGLYQHAILVGDSSWHEGVVGIVASKVTETFQKPAAVLALRDDFGKGSVRSYGGKDILAALQRCAPLLKGFGGHKYAAGLSVELENFEKLITAFDDAVGALVLESGDSMPLLTEGESKMEELDFKTLQEIERLGPFGPGNPEPVFVLRAKAASHQVLKGRHLKLSLTPVGTPSQNRIFMEAIWFHAAEREESFESATNDAGLWAVIPEINRFRGRATPSLRVKDRREWSDTEIFQ